MHTKHFIPFLLFLVLSLPAVTALASPGLYTAHDLEGHVIRLIDFSGALSEGEFPVRWAKRLNWGLGYPYFNFNYPWVYYFLTIITRVSGYETAIKIAMASTFPLAGFFTYLWLTRHFNQRSAMMGGLFYMYVPYHFANAYVRGNIAESMALTIVPLVFYFIAKPGLGLTISLTLLVLSHNITAMIFIPILIGYTWGLGKVSKVLKPTAMAMGITAFFWIPAIIEKQYIIIDQEFPKYFEHHFPILRNLFYSPWGYGASMAGREAGEMSVQVGLVHWGIMGLGVLLLGTGFKGGRSDYETPLTQTESRSFADGYKWHKYFLMTTIIAILLMLEISMPIWRTVKPLQYLQFPWRLLGVVNFGLAFISASIISIIFGNAGLFRTGNIILHDLTAGAMYHYRLRRNLILHPHSYDRDFPSYDKILFPIAFLVLLFFNRNHWKVNEYYPIRANWLSDTPLETTTTVDGEHTPKWQNTKLANTNRWETSLPTEVKLLSWKTGYHKFTINSPNTIIFIDRTVYYPGWELWVDNKKSQLIDKFDPLSQGLLATHVSSGTHVVESKWKETPMRMGANIISLLSVIVTFYSLTYRKVESTDVQ